ncbi:hypothetical protein BM536_034305 [Streptomyces phaeoluteigriseus]|uniref:Lipoprotein n=1 Tax=Streptomyces phaeoluteigriseus TaxID=114686 RepID=A0A1V6ML45_9ACTN|nr:hypothetical protein [Streptomyces phaeoluteigriseus]OQD53171.1 hypothetical protein BM536_034305 [Streptomyces phaeoluteigriseus]
MRTRSSIIVAAALLALTACSSGGDEGGSASDSGPAEAEPTIAVPEAHEGDDLEAAAAVYTSAYFAADTDTAYGMLSARCREEIGADAYTALVEKAKADHGPDHPATDVRAEVSGKLGRVSYKVRGLPQFDQRAQPWTLEDGGWKYDAC